MTIAQFSRGTAYTVGLSQLAVTLAVVAIFPAVLVQTYTCHPVVCNGTVDLAQPAPLQVSLSCVKGVTLA